MRWDFVLVALLAGSSCASPSPGEAGTLFERAREFARDGNADAAFDALEQSFDAGFARSSEVLRVADFQILLDDANWRPRVRELLHEHARESTITMVRPSEPGESMRLELWLLDRRSGEPVSGVKVLLVHVDAEGLYQPWAAEQDWNPRLFGSAVSDADGVIVAHSIRPAYYAAVYQADEPAHVHFNFDAPGYHPYYSELRFDDDPRQVGEALAESKREGLPVAAMMRDDDGGWRGTVVIRLSPRR